VPVSARIQPLQHRTTTYAVDLNQRSLCDRVVVWRLGYDEKSYGRARASAVRFNPCTDLLSVSFQSGHALTVEGSSGNQVTNPLLRIATIC
jgi:hypothetical protein